MDGYGECGVRLSKGMLPQNHCTCQEKVEANLEVIGGAGVRGGAGQLETIRQKLGLTSETAIYWATGILSALLDNAPTYLAFFAAALGLHHFDINEPSQVADFISKNGGELIALSLGATFFGALTYIGNAPNLLVKTIAEHGQVPTPSFIGYIWKFALPILIPAFVLVSIFFFPGSASVAPGQH